MFLFLLQPTPTVAWYQEPITLATIVIALSAALYTYFTLKLLGAANRNNRTANAIFEAAYRPYLSVTVACEVNQQKQEMVFRMPLTNAGNVPANDVRRDLKILVDGFQLEMDKFESQGQCVMPHSEMEHTIILSGDRFKKVMEASTMSLSLKFDYQGINENQYEYRMECVYYKSKNSLAVTRTKST
jgi:hypothetical protein